MKPYNALPSPAGLVIIGTRQNANKTPMTSRADTSNISFTAHYTGFVWYHAGLSETAFVTPQGWLYFQLLRPFEALARRLIGTDIRTTLLQRHLLLDHELNRLVLEHDVVQVLELASGLSPRGTRFCGRHGRLRYVETDLPGMVAYKRALLDKLGVRNERHPVEVCNILADEGEHTLEKVLARFDRSRPVVVIMEGLVNYFDLAVISGVWQRLATALRAFPQAWYLTDVYPRVPEHRAYGLIRAANESLRLASRSHFQLHFESAEEMQTHFRALGYDEVQVFNPDLDRLPGMPAARGGSIVRTLAAAVTR